LLGAAGTSPLACGKLKSAAQPLAARPGGHDHVQVRARHRQQDLVGRRRRVQ